MGGRPCSRLRPTVLTGRVRFGADYGTIDWQLCRSVSRFQASAPPAVGKALSGQVDLGDDHHGARAGF